ncbi:MAG: class B sortase, partial [Hydrogeniiclostridium sp.]
IYAWLRIPGTEFDFPLVQRSGDDTFYLTHDSDRNESSAGAIFTESAYNGTDMEDPVTVAYGHQMQAGTMFGRLQATYSEKDSLKEYGEMIVYLPDKELHYTVFAAVPYDNRHILYQYDFSSGRRYNAFLNSIFEVREIGAQMSSEITVSPEDKLLILSTCMQGNPQRRYLVLAKCVKEID